MSDEQRQELRKLLAHEPYLDICAIHAECFGRSTVNMIDEIVWHPNAAAILASFADAEECEKIGDSHE